MKVNLAVMVLLTAMSMDPAPARGCQTEAKGPYDETGRPDGEWRIVECDGTETIGTLRSGTWHGPITVLRPDGRKDTGHYEHGRKEGAWTYSQLDGARVSGPYRRGLLHGEWAFYGKDGRIAARECWRAGKWIGLGSCSE